MQAIRNKISKMGYSQHILNYRHSFSNIQDTMQILNIQQIGLYLNTVENPHNYTTRKTGHPLNDVYSDIYNPIFAILIYH